METIHPILIIKDTSLSEKYNRFIQEFRGIQDEGLVSFCDFNEITSISFSTIKPSREKKLDFKSKGIDLVYPIIISLIEFENDQQANNFINYCDYVKDNINQFKISDENDFRFINIFITNLERKEYDKSKQDFIQRFERYCNENNLPLENTYNFLIDKYSEYNLDEVEKSQTIVSQLFSAVKQLISSHHIEDYKLSHSRQSTSVEAPSSVRYNSLGLASIGFQYEKVREGIKINRKSEFLNEIIKGNNLTEDQKLEISKLSNNFISEQIQPISERIRTNSFNNSFHDLTIESVNDFRKEQERQIENLDSSELDTQIRLVQNRILRDYDNFSKKLESAEEKSIQFSNKLSTQFKEELSRYVNNLISKFEANSSIYSGLIGLVNLVERPTQHLVIEKGGNTYETIKEIKEKIEQDNNSIEPANIDESDSERTELIEQLNRINQRLSQQIEEVNNYNLSKKIKLNLLWVLAGLVLSILIIWIVPTFKFFDFDVITLSTKLKFSIWPIIIGLIIFANKSFKHYRQLENIKKKLIPLGNRRISLIRNYVNTYHNYFEAIKSKLVLKHSEFALERFIGSIEKEKYQINSFKQSLIRLKKKFDINNEDFALEEDIFNKSIISKEDINEFCKVHPLEFFQNNSVPKYYSEFKKGKTMFEPFLPKVNGTRLEIDIDEKIAAADVESDKSISKEYKEINNGVSLFLASDNEYDDILYSDVKQGNLGDCYFLASLSSIAHKSPEYIRHIIEREGDNYIVHFWNEDQLRLSVLVDSKFWVQQDTDNPIYAKYGSSNDIQRETWVMAVEKAWAKINKKNYRNIIGSFGKNRDRDFSLALTGKRSIYEHLSVKELTKETITRLTEHLKKKPVVLYSLNTLVDESEKNLVTRHAYSLLKISNGECEIYNPHGSTLNIPIEKLRYNFDTILYFDFEMETDNHLLGLYSEFIGKSGINSLEKDMDNLIEKDLKTSFDDKSFEQLLPSFNYELNPEKAEKFAEFLISASIPNVYLPNLPSSKPSCQIIGKNELVNNKIKEKLRNKGYKDENYIGIDQNMKKIGLLQIRNNIRVENIINP